MFTISLVRVPGIGQRDVQVNDPNMTLAQFVAAQELHGRSLIVNGEAADPSSWNTRTLNGVQEIFAMGAVKGN